jgi:hypothetical protein
MLRLLEVLFILASVTGCEKETRKQPFAQLRHQFQLNHPELDRPESDSDR